MKQALSNESFWKLQERDHVGNLRVLVNGKSLLKYISKK
jgi:hypothetical protein